MNCYTNNYLLSIILFVTISIFSFSSCDTTETQNKPELKLEIRDITCTEVWLQLTTNNLQLPTDIIILTNNTATRVLNLSTKDTLFYIDSLLPNQNYSFQTSEFNQIISSNKINIRTLDTTSHAIHWEVETVGDLGSRALDVAVINENDIWIVGEFYETFGSDTVYNAAHWDGSIWNLIAIPIRNYGGFIYPTRLTCIQAFSSNNIWVFSDGGSYARFDGSIWTSEWVEARQGGIAKLWGTSSNNIFFVGSNGTITHYDGNNFTKMESNTNVYLKDIYGTPDGKEVWVCGWNDSDGNGVLLRLKGNEWEKIYERNTLTNNLPYTSFLSSLWIGDNKEFFVTGVASGIVKHSTLDSRIARIELFNIQNFPYRIRGNAVNDIFLAGDASMIWHYNGQTWKHYLELENTSSIIRSISVNQNNIAAAGLYFPSVLSKALVIRGKK